MVGLLCAVLFVALSTTLAIVHFTDGAWVQGSLWAASSLFFAVAYGSSLLHWRRS